MWKFNSWLKAFVLTVSSLMAVHSSFAKDLSPEELARKLKLRLEKLPRSLISQTDPLKGDYFEYFPPQESSQTWGIMVPVNDQSYLDETAGVEIIGGIKIPPPPFSAVVRDNEISAPVVRTISSRIEQMRAAYRYGSPEVHRLVLLNGDGLEPVLGIKAEHIEGEKIPVNIQDRNPRVNRQFLELFSEFHANGLVPLDYRYANIFITADEQLRPYDVLLMKISELSDWAVSHPRAFDFRMLQLAHTNVDVERALAVAPPKLSDRCQNIIARLRSKFPRSIEKERGVRSQLDTALRAHEWALSH